MADFYTDSRIAIETGTELIQRGHTVVRCFHVGLVHAPDHVHLRYAAQHGLIVLTHDRGFILWNQAWLDWSATWNVQALHRGILILPIERLCPEPVAAARIDELLQLSPDLSNRCLELTEGGVWIER